MSKKSNRLIDVLAEEERKTFLTETVIPKIEKLLNYIRVSDLGRYDSDQRDRDHDYITEMKTRIIRGKYPVTKKDLELCNELYQKYKYDY